MMKNYWNSFTNSLKEVLSIVINHIRIFVAIIFILSCVVFALLFKDNSIICIVGIILNYLVLHLIADFISNVSRTSRADIPVLNKRLTKKDDGRIYIEESVWQQAIIYLSNIEDYLERIGKLKK